MLKEVMLTARVEEECCGEKLRMARYKREKTRATSGKVVDFFGIGVRLDEDVVIRGVECEECGKVFIRSMEWNNNKQDE